MNELSREELIALICRQNHDMARYSVQNNKLAAELKAVEADRDELKALKLYDARPALEALVSEEEYRALLGIDETVPVKHLPDIELSHSVTLKDVKLYKNKPEHTLNQGIPESVTATDLINAHAKEEEEFVRILTQAVRDDADRTINFFKPIDDKKGDE